uniref:Uncharacterized protein n=1 Tax=Meloidogyne javanica TaxID=6303 RepID=A0A915LMB8_MELJA
KQKLNEFISSVSDNNEREVELQRQVSQLQHEVKRLTGELATLEAKLKALSSKANDGLDSYLEECIEQEETEAADRIELERKNIQIEIDENSGPVDEPMEQDLVDDDVIDANLTTTPASQNNLSQLQSPNDRRPLNSAAKTRANPDSQMIIQNSQCFIPLPRYTDERIREFCVDDLETDLAT